MRGRHALTAGLSAVLLGGGVLPITASPALAAGSIPLTALDTPYAQDFDTLANSGTANTALPKRVGPRRGGHEHAEQRRVRRQHRRRQRR